jgi:prepilin-type processing-associated H-X9-DG protein
MTLTEVLVVVFIVTILLAVILPALPRRYDWRKYESCVNNLKQIGLAYRIWEGDNNDKYPNTVSVTNGGAMELAMTGNVAAVFLVMSNELGTPKVVLCPRDLEKDYAANFSDGFSAKNVSYFVNLDATNDDNPRLFLSGDGNFAIGGVPVKSGLLELSTNSPISWTAARHKFAGNIGLVDGSVESTSSSSLRQILVQTGAATNRLAIP